MWNSSAPGLVAVGGSILVAIPETIVSPVTLYVDAAEYPPTASDDHTYCSYIGCRTLWDSNLHDVNKVVASFIMVPLETLWFPIGGVLDLFYVATSD